MSFTPVFVTVLFTVFFAGAGIASASSGSQAQQNWILNCQGCHQADGAGSEGGAPNMAGFVGRFLSVPGGREFLVQVPGVAYAPLPDNEVAALLNWMLHKLDEKNIPDSFSEYSEEEVARLRNHPLVEDAPARRAELIEVIERTLAKASK